MNASNSFKSSVVVALDDIQLQTAFDRGTTRAVNGRISAMGETSAAPELRAQARAARLRALNQLPELLDTLERNVTANGAVWEGRTPPGETAA